jgi:hypothetical protein
VIEAAFSLSEGARRLLKKALFGSAEEPVRW